MTLSELMDALSARDVRLSLRLVVDAPPGALTDELRFELAAHKPAVIRRLVESVQEPTPDPETMTQAEMAPYGDFMPPAGSWHRSIVWWPATRRKRWADRAKALQAEGLRSDVAEWAAFREAVDEINAAEAAGEKIDFQVPADHPASRARAPAHLREHA
jgi:hypothetical protein